MSVRGYVRFVVPALVVALACGPTVARDRDVAAATALPAQVAAVPLADPSNVKAVPIPPADPRGLIDPELARDEAYVRLAATLARDPSLPAFTGRLANWPIVGRITSPFGPRWGGFHNGLDIAATALLPVRAAAAGQVVTVGKPYLAYGDTATMVIIAHGSDLATVYVHLSDDRPPIVQVGQRVTAGEVVAYNGSTGWSTGPHVHFMVIVSGRAVDPIPYLP